MDNTEYIYGTSQVKSTFPYYISSIRLYSKKLYVVMLGMLFLLILSLPFIKVDLYVRAPGIIRPGTEKTPVRSMISGTVSGVNFTESDRLEKGEVLLKLDRKRKEYELDQLKSLSDQINRESRDLENLLSASRKQLISVRYKLEYEAYSKQLKQLAEKLDKASREKARNEPLYCERMISEKEFDDLLFNEKQRRQELDHFKYTRRNQWQNELSKLQFRQKQYEGQINCLLEDLRYCEIRAPVSGIIEHLPPIMPGSFIQSGQQIAVIIPDTIIIGEFYVKPADIGLIYINQQVQLIIDAFDYRQWGSVSSVVNEISDDFVLVGNQPVFRVRCKPLKDKMELKNGYSGSLKKGMTLQAICLVSRKSIWQLMTGKMNDWLNPAKSSYKPASIASNEKKH